MAYSLSHPDSDAEIQVEADMVSVYATQGWETKPTARAPEADKK